MGNDKRNNWINIKNEKRKRWRKKRTKKLKEWKMKRMRKAKEWKGAAKMVEIDNGMEKVKY